jgi:hypothetical protein
MSYQNAKPRYLSSEDEHSPHLAALPHLVCLPGNRIAYPPSFRADLLVEQPQPLHSIYASVGQHDRVVLDDTLRVVCIGHVAGQFVELGATDGTDGGGRGGIGRGRCEGRVAGGCLERGQAGGQGDVEERPGRERVEAVVSGEEEGGQVGPAGGRVERLRGLAIMREAKRRVGSRALTA